MDAWLTSLPPQGLLELELVIAPSWPERGSGGVSAEEQFRKWATSNIYVTRIVLPDGDEVTTRYDVAGHALGDDEVPAVTEAQFASVLRLGRFDAAAYTEQTIQIEGWAEGSAGVAGYVERRRTNLRL